MHVLFGPLFTLLHDDVSSFFNEEHEANFLQVKQTLTHNCELTLPNPKKIFLHSVDVSANGVGTLFNQADDVGQMQITS